jgi:D-xylose transport system substrate-binding protein
VLLGKQTATVYKPFQLEVKAAVDVIKSIAAGKTYSTTMQNNGVPYVALTPVSVGPDQVKDVVADGNAKATDICTAAVAAACAKHGVK